MPAISRKNEANHSFLLPSSRPLVDAISQQYIERFDSSPLSVYNLPLYHSNPSLSNQTITSACKSAVGGIACPEAEDVGGRTSTIRIKL